MKHARVNDILLLNEILSNPGATDQELGEKLGLSRVQIWRRRNDSEFQILLQKNAARSFEIFRHHQLLATARICELISHPDPRIALKASELVIGFVGQSGETHSKEQVSKRLFELVERIKKHTNIK